MAANEEVGESIFKAPVQSVPSSDGVGRTQNTTPGEKQRQDVTNQNDSIFHIDVRMVTCVHGTWSASDQTPATFLVFHNEFNCLQNHVIRKVKIEWEFINDKEAQPFSMPTIAERGPHVLRLYKDSSEEVHDQVGFEAGAEGNVPVVKPALKVNWGRSRDYQRQYFAEARSGIQHASNTDHRYTKAWWIYKQNEQKHNSVPAAFRIAILLKRKNASAFQGLFTLSEFDAGWRYNLISAWNAFTGSVQPNIDDPINFDPSRDPLGGTGIDPTCLGDLVTDDEGIDKRYAWIWGVDLGK